MIIRFRNICVIYLSILSQDIDPVSTIDRLATNDVMHLVFQNIDGSSLMTLSSDQLTRLVSVVDGPQGRLFDLIQQVKSCNGIASTEMSAGLGDL